MVHVEIFKMTVVVDVNSARPRSQVTLSKSILKHLQKVFEVNSHGMIS